MADAAVHAEQFGYHGFFTSEINHDPFLPLAVAAAKTSRIELGTAIAVAFARSPMTVALAAHDLQQQSGGRFVLGLGTQIKPHITQRYSMPWSRPADRLREFVLALRAIWRTWETGTALNFRGEFYAHTLMTPFFHPEPHRHDDPAILLAAVGPKLTEVAGEVADGLLLHTFTTPDYIAGVTLPAVEAGLRAAGRSRDAFELSAPVLIATGRDDREYAKAMKAVKRQIAFYGSTPAYRPVLEHHGWGGLQTKLHALSKRGEWKTMAGLIDDDVLDAFAVHGDPAHVAEGIRRRVKALVDRVTLSQPAPLDPTVATEIAAAVQAPARVESAIEI